MTHESGLTHLDERGHAHMVNVAEKHVSHRRAVAEARVHCKPDTIAMIVENRVPKGDVFATARVAGIMASKRTSDLIPLCHPLALTHATVEIEIPEAHPPAILITAAVETDGKTGVEMEALTAASVAALTIYDMCKAVDRGMQICELRLLHKDGGKSGTWDREEES